MPKVVQSDPILDCRVFRVRTDVITDNGKNHVVDIVEHPVSYTILARPHADEVLLIRQYRHAAGGYLWELPAGSSEPGEAPLDGVRRELREETGYSAETVREFLTSYMTPGFCTELMRYFVADGLTSGATEFDDDEDIETRTFRIDLALEMIESGEIVDANTIVGLLYFARYLSSQ